MVASVGHAQRKEISTAKGYVKNNQNLDKAEESMRKLLGDSANRHNEKIWDVLFSAVKKQYDNCNEQMYLKKTADTSKLFVNARKMFDIYEAYDSIDALPDAHGNVSPKERKPHAAFLLNYRKNLYGGGLFYVKKQNFVEAYNMFDTYIGCATHPLFSSYNISENDDKLTKAAYMAMYSAYKAKDVAKTLKHAELAMRDTSNLNNKLQYLAGAYLMQKDTMSYIATLEQGFDKYPTSLYYFPRLFNHYFNVVRNREKALALCDKAISADSTNTVFLFAQSSLMLDLGRYDECVSISDRIISRNDSIAAAYQNAGLAYYNQAVKLENSVSKTKSQRTKLLDLYKRSLPYMKRFRELAPEQKENWGVPLYTIYLNLNMGKDFEEIDKLLREDNGKK